MRITPGRLGKCGALVAAALLLNLHSSVLSGQGGPFHFREVHLGLEVRITAHGQEDQAAMAAAAAFERIATLEQVLSDWRPGSELNRAVTAASQDWTPISRELESVLHLALRIAAASDGAFDPTIGALTRLWREARRTGTFPTGEQISAARATVGWHNVLLDSMRHQMRITTPGTLLDLGGIAKGWILQQALVTMRMQGVHAALIEAGGDLVAGRPPPGSEGWRVNLQTPHGDSMMVIHDAAMAVSGPSAQSIDDMAGRSRSHVIDPAAGLGLQNGVEVTVIADDGAIADAMATTLTVMPRSQWTDLLERFGAKLVVATDLTRDL